MFDGNDGELKLYSFNGITELRVTTTNKTEKKKNKMKNAFLSYLFSSG